MSNVNDGSVTPMFPEITVTVPASSSQEVSLTLILKQLYDQGLGDEEVEEYVREVKEHGFWGTTNRWFYIEENIL